MKHPDYPGVSSMTTRHGKLRWRYRRHGQKDVMLPGEPGTAAFDAAYRLIVQGRGAEIVRHPSAAHPRSLEAAYRLLAADTDPEGWKKLDDRSRRRYRQTIERVLAIPLPNGGQIGDAPVADLKRKHVKKILSGFSETPHMERIVLICLRKLIMVAIEEEWIEADPTYGMKRSPRTGGHKAWTAEIMQKYEACWPLGSRQRVAYALALWLGNRVSDVARLRWSDLTVRRFLEGDAIVEVEGFEFMQFKGRRKSGARPIFLPLTPMLERELAPLPRDTHTVLVSSRGRGYTDASLSNRMMDWCREAGLPAGYSMHGLRKALGVKLAEADASTRQLMDVLGHHNIAFAELYSREASQAKLAVEGMRKVTRMEGAGRPRLSIVD